MSKLLVATRTSRADQKHQKILKALSYYPEGATPKILSRETGVNVNTIKSILPKLKGIKKVIRGLYKVAERGDTHPAVASGVLSSWCFHNLVLSSVLSGYKGRLVSSTHSFGLVNAKFVLSSVGNASLIVSTDFPLNVASIGVVFAYFLEQCAKYCDTLITEESCLVRTIEFNRDYSNLRLDGLRCITLNSLVEQFKVYQKRSGLRVEHKAKVSFTVENIVDMLSNNPNTLESNIRLSAQAADLRRLTLATSVNTGLLYKLIDVLKAR